MQSKKRMLINSILCILLILITFKLVFKNYAFTKTIKIITQANIKYIILAVIVMFLSLVLESINIKQIIQKIGHKISIIDSIKYSLIGFLFSGITPGGSGGQPVQIYYMKKDNIKVSSSTIALLVEICSFHIITIFLGIIGLILNINLLTKEFLWIFIIGIAFKSIILIVILTCLFTKKVTDFFVQIVIKILNKIKYHNLDALEEKINSTLSQYRDSAKYIKKNKYVLFKSLFIVLLQVIMNYTVVYFVYKSFGLNQYSYIKILLIQSLLLVSTSSIPLPGAIGISEHAFLTLYLRVFGENILASAMLLCRGINFYLFMIISLIVFIMDTIKIKQSSKTR